MHLGGVGANDSGISVSPRFRRSIVFRVLLWRLGIRRAELPRADRLYVERLSALVRESASIDQAVVLALDGRWRDGEIDRERSPLVVPNDWARDAAREHPELLFGASINPLRPDALDELDRVVEDGAVLLKWLPNVMGFDPAESRHRPFYRKLADLGLPLLAHTGAEYTLPGGDHSGGNPMNLAPALEEGVTVIFAHCGTLCRPRLPDGRRVSGREALAFLAERHPNLRADLSALTAFPRGFLLRRVLDHPTLGPRLLDATDFPVPSFPWTQLGRAGLGDILRARRVANPFDRDRALKRAAGMPIEMTTRAAEVLRLPR